MRWLVAAEQTRARFRGPGSAIGRAKIALGLGDTGGARLQLNEAARAHDGLFFAAEPLVAGLFDEVRTQPSFAALVLRHGLDVSRFTRAAQ